MRSIIFAAVAFSGLAAFQSVPAKAAQDYPFCLRTSDDSDECYYPTYQSCRDAASGRGLTCFQNPALAYAAPYQDDVPPPRRRSRARTY